MAALNKILCWIFQISRAHLPLDSNIHRGMALPVQYNLHLYSDWNILNWSWKRLQCVYFIYSINVRGSTFELTI